MIIQFVSRLISRDNTQTVKLFVAHANKPDELVETCSPDNVQSRLNKIAESLTPSEPEHMVAGRKKNRPDTERWMYDTYSGHCYGKVCYAA